MSILCSLIRWQGRLSNGAILKELQNDPLGIHNHRAHKLRALSHRNVRICQGRNVFWTMAVAKHRDGTTSTDKLAGVEVKLKYGEGKQE